MKAKILIPCLVLAAMAPGCISRIAKEGLATARGAKGVHATLQEAPSLEQYRRIELGQITDDFGGKVPAGMWAPFREEFHEQLIEKELPNDPSGKTLLVRGKILHFEVSGALGHAFGPLEEVLARIELVDKASGKVLGTANCIGRSTSTKNSGVDMKGRGLAKAITSWLASRYRSTEDE